MSESVDDSRIKGRRFDDGSSIDIKDPMGKPVSPHGFVSYAPDGAPTYLPLKSVCAKVYIVDVSARVILTQIYDNSHSNNRQCSSAQYIFPVPANGAVCAFTMQTADGRIVRGVVKEREQAVKEYEFAIAHNTFAGLVYEATPDIFVITLGAIPGGQDVQVTIMYITPLTDSDLPGYDQIEFILPTYIGIRYGPPPASLPHIHSSSQRLASRASHSHSEKTMLDIEVHIQMPSEILEILSCTHAIKVDAHTTRADSRLGPSTPYTATVTLDPSGSPPRLNWDFVLAIRSAQLGVPRCVAEIVKGPYSAAGSASSVALALTLVPRLKLRASSVSSSTSSPKLPQMQQKHEYIFLIDRSGSMAHSRIELAKEALMLFVKSLPSGVDGAGVRTMFNVFGFGSTCVGLWNTSRGYDEASVRFALDHVKSIDADLGGTEILHALRSVVHTRNSAIPTSIFVLTDGEVYDIEAIFAFVSSAVAQSASASQSTSASSPSPAPLRFFTLGIGDSASTALCEGIARAGGGVCLMSRKEADVSGKCGRLLTAAASAALGVLSTGTGGVGLDLGMGATSNGGDRKGKSGGGIANLAGQMELYWGHDPGNLLQAPTRIPALHPENRLTVYAILHDVDVDLDGVPEEVVLYQRGNDGKQSEVGRVSVCLVEDPMRTLNKGYGTRGENKETPPLIHTIAAHRIIQELEDGNLDTLHAVCGQSLHGARAHKGTGGMEKRVEIVRLSERFQVASKWASFVAVEGALYGNGDGHLDVDKKKSGVKGVGVEDKDDDADDDDDFYLDEEEEARAKARASASRIGKVTSNANVSSIVHPDSNVTAGAKDRARNARSNLNTTAPRMTDTSTHTQAHPHNAHSRLNAGASTAPNPVSTSHSVPVSSTLVSLGGTKPVTGTGSREVATTWNYAPWPGVDDPKPVKSDQTYSNSNANVSAQSRGLPSTTASNGIPSSASGIMGRPLGLRRSHTRIASASVLPHDVSLANSTTITAAKIPSSAETGTTQISSHFVNAFKSLGPSTGSASNPSAGHNSVSSTGGPLRAKRSVYFLDTISTVDEAYSGFSKDEVDASSTQTSVGHVDDPGDEPQNTVLPSTEVHPKIGQFTSPAPVGWDTCLDHAHAAGGCHAHMRMPGAYPHSHGCCPCFCFCCCCCSHRHCHHHHHHHNYFEPQFIPPPSPPAPKPTPTPAPNPQPGISLNTLRHPSVPVRGGRLGARPQSVMYELETAVCLSSFLNPVSGTAVLGTVDEEDEDGDKDEAPLLFVPTARSKSGVYRASDAKPDDENDEPVTTPAPIIAAANMQRFDGSFVLDAQLRALVSNSRKKVTLERLREAIPARLREHVGGNAHEAETVWATVLVAAYLKKALPQEKEVWIGLWDKAVTYIEGKVGKNASQGEGLSFARLVLEASRLV